MEGEFCRSSSTTERKESMAESERLMVNPNEADVETLSELPGVGPEMAQRIIDARPYERAEDLTRVEGIDPDTVARLQSHLTFNGGEDSGEAAETEGEAEAVEVKAAEAEETYEVPPSPEEAAREPYEFSGVEEKETEAPPSALEEVEELETPLEPVLEVPEEAEAEQPPVGVQTALGAEVEEPEAEAAEEAPEAEEEEEERAEAVPAMAREEPQPARRGWVLWTVAGSALLVLILSLGVNLGILASINAGRLQFASPAEVGEVRVRVDGLNERASELSQEVQGLRTRLDNVEAFGGRIDSLEGTTQELGTELEDTASEVQSLSTELNALDQELNGLNQELATLNQEVAGVQDEVQTLQDQTARTQSFFDGLRTLLDDLFVTDGGEQ
jgi:prefoldin subunit 5